MPHMLAGLGVAVPALGVPEQLVLAMIVCVFEAGTGLVPVSVDDPRLKLAKDVVPRLMVFEIVAPAATSAVTYIYPVVPEEMFCEVKEGKTLLPAVPGVVSVERRVDEPTLKVEEEEYQHFKLVMSAEA